jgi:hypothetical protein
VGALPRFFSEDYTMIRLPKWTCIALALLLIFALRAPALAVDRIKKVAAADKQLVVTDKDGKDVTYTVADKAKIFLSTGKQGKLDDLKAGQNVILLHERKGGKLTANVILDCQGAFKDANLAHGMIQSVAADKKEFSLKNSTNKNQTFTLATNGKITLSDKASKLDDLKRGDHVVIAFQKKGGKNIAMCVCSWPE